MICDIHRRFLEAGADIIETNTFGATSIGQSEFFVDDPREHGGRKDPAFYQKIIDDPFLNGLAWEINEQSARQCREWADRVGSADGRRRFVAGAIGPLTVSLSNSPDADDAGFRVVTFDQVKDAYARQVRALIAGGSDVLLVETIFDSLNAKAALVAIEEVFDKDGKILPVMISAAVGRGGETMISAQTVEALWNAVKHVKPISIGLNCSLGPDLMYPFLSELSEKSGAAISCYPNAGLPNPLSETGFDLGPADMGRYLREFADGGLINIAGGCCGNTPEHIAAIARALEGRPPRELPVEERPAEAKEDAAKAPRPLRLSGSQPFTQQPGVYIMIGERTNVAGSPKFAKLVKEGKYEDAVSVARQQVENGANVIDICMDEGMIDGVAAMTRFLSLLGSEPEVAKVPFMVDSSKWEVIEAGLKFLQGKGIVNSISLKEGEDRFRQNARKILQVRRRDGRDGLRRAGPGGDLRGQDPHLRARLPHPRRRGGLSARGHHLRPEHPHRRHRDRGAQQLRRRLHERDAVDQGEPAARQGERRRVERLVQLPRQQPRPRGDALRVPLPRHPGRDGHGHRQRRDARGVRGDRRRSCASWSRTCSSIAAPTRPSGSSTSARS